MAMQLLALALVALFVFLLVSRFAKRRRGGAGSLQQEAAIEAWARAEMARLIAERLELEESDVATTLAGNLTLLGSVANIIVIETAKAEDEMGFVTYIKVGLPVTIASMVAGIGTLMLTR